MKKFMFMPFLLLVVWLAVGVVAQGDTPLPPSEDPTRKSADDKLADIGNAVPGFGGMFIDPANPNVLKVFLTDTENTTQKDNAETAIRENFPGSVPSGGVVAVQGQYTLSQLTDWYKKVIEAVVSSDLDTSKLVGTDLEEDKNRVEISVKDEAAVAVVEAAIAGLADVPRDAVRITIRGGFRFRTSVQDRIRPLVGGIQLQGEDQGLCTLGFVAKRSGTFGVTTNSHCTETFASVDSTVFYQQEEDDDDDKIGTETVDGGYIVCPYPYNLFPSDYTCKNADVVFVPLDSGVTKDMGHIARTAGSGSTTISTSNPRYRVVSETSSGTVGQALAFVGRTSGSATPIITDTCANIFNEEGIYMLCQGIASLVGGSELGDSGAPVFRITNSPLYGDVSLYGILWGGSSEDDEIAYSTMSRIQNSSELGSIKTCALEIGC